MEAFAVAGAADDPALAEAELLGDLLVKSFPRVGFAVDMRHPCEWPEFRAKLCRLHGFASPGVAAVVWRRDGRLVGTVADFVRAVKDAYDLELSPEIRELIPAITAENLVNAAQAAKEDAWTPYLGRARKEWIDGIVFEGIWKDHAPVKGAVKFPDGSTFEGSLKGGRFHGHGKRTFPDGGKFVGQFRAGRREGMGKYADAVGNEFDGDYSADTGHGKGTRRWPSGRQYTGDWNKNEATGHGMETRLVNVVVEPPEPPEPPEVIESETEDPEDEERAPRSRPFWAAGIGLALPDPWQFVRGKPGEVAFPATFQITREQALAAVECYDIFVPPDVKAVVGAGTSRKFTEGEWEDVPFGLSFHSDDYSAYFNMNHDGVNNGMYIPVGIVPPMNRFLSTPASASSTDTVGNLPARPVCFLLAMQGEGPFPDSHQVVKELAIPAVLSVLGAEATQGRDLLQVGDYEYMFEAQELSWDEHSHKAKIWGGNLVSITSKEENMHVLKLCGEFPPAHMWIGGMRRSTALTFASDHPSNVAMRSKSGAKDNWEWSDSGPWGFTNWGLSQPANEGGNNWTTTCRYHAFRNVRSGKYIHLPGNPDGPEHRVVQWDCIEMGSKFEILQVGDDALESVPSIASGTIILLKSASSGLFLSSHGDENGLVTQSESPDDTSRFTVEGEEGQYQFKTIASGLCLHVAAGYGTKGEAVKLVDNEDEGSSWEVVTDEEDLTTHHVSVFQNRVAMNADGTWKDEHFEVAHPAVYSRVRKDVHSDSESCLLPWRAPSGMPPFGLSFQSVCNKQPGDFAAHYCTNRARKNDGNYTPVGMLPGMPEQAFLPSTRMYRGGFLKGRFHGNGFMEYETRDTYDGEWNNGLREGSGMYSWVSACSVGGGGRMTFDGVFEKDMPKYGLLRIQGDSAYPPINTLFPGEISLSPEDMIQWRRALPELVLSEGGWLDRARDRVAVTELYDDYPVRDLRHNVMSRVLTRGMWETLHRRVTPSGVTLQSCIAPGLDLKSTAHPLGLRASDPDCYLVFRELFDGVIREVHDGFDPFNSVQPTDIEGGETEAWKKIKKMSWTAKEASLSWKLQFDRNLSSFPSAAVIDVDGRRRVEEIIVNALLRMGETDGNEHLRGEYFPLEGSESWSDKMGGMSALEADKLRAAGLIFSEADCSDTRDWPEGRGVFITDSKKLIVHINKEEHASFFCVGGPENQGLEFCDMFKILRTALNTVGHIMYEDEEQEWAHSNNLGFLLTSLDKIGTGMTIEMIVKLPRLTKRLSIQTMMKETGLNLKELIPVVSGAVQVQDTFSLSTPQKLGASEVEILNSLIVGANELCKHERSLAGGRKKMWLLEDSPKVLLLGIKEALADDITFATQLAEEFDLDVITPQVALQAEIDEDTKLGKTAMMYRNAGKPMPRAAVCQCILNLLKARESQHVRCGGKPQGWVCSGFPASPEEVEMLIGHSNASDAPVSENLHFSILAPNEPLRATAEEKVTVKDDSIKIKPNKIINLQPDDVAMQEAIARRLSRRRDRATKQILYLADEPDSKRAKDDCRPRTVAKEKYPCGPSRREVELALASPLEKLSEDRGSLPQEAATGYQTGFEKLRKAVSKIGPSVCTLTMSTPAQTAKGMFEYVAAVPGFDPPMMIREDRLRNDTNQSVAPTTRRPASAAALGSASGGQPLSFAQEPGAPRPATARK